MALNKKNNISIEKNSELRYNILDYFMKGGFYPHDYRYEWNI